MKKILIIPIIIALAVLGGYALLRNSNLFLAAPSAPSVENSPVNSAQEQKTPQPQDKTPEPSAAETANVIIYSDSGYAPNSITVKAGESVTYKNQSSRAMWPASAMHPTHRVYPTTGGGLGSTFDACRGVLAGGSWTFTFDIAGTWKYHDHLNPSASNSGTVIVE